MRRGRRRPDRRTSDPIGITFERKGRLSSYAGEIPDFNLRPAVKADCPTILHFIRELAAYEKLNHELVVIEDRLRQKLFGEHPAAEVVFGQSGDQAIGFALYLPTYSTFLAQPGIYLEDLFVDLAWARLRPARMDGARLERAGDSVLPLARRSAYGRMDGEPRYGCDAKGSG